MISLALVYVFPAIMIIAAISDVSTFRIPNWMPLVLVGTFPLAYWASGLPVDSVWLFIGAGVGTLVVTFTLFALNWIGGGDAKLAAATALWLGWPLTLNYLLQATIFGGVLTIAILLLRWKPLPAGWARAGWIGRLQDRKSGVPYGVALAVAGLVIYGQSALFAGLIG